MCACARPSTSSLKAGRISITSRCRIIAGGSFLKPRRPGCESRLRRQLWDARLSGSAGRVSQLPAPHHRDAGRHGTCLRRAATPARQDLSVALRPAQSLSGERRRRPSPLGDGLSAATATSGATGATKPTPCSSAAAATPTSRASSKRLISRVTTGSTFSLHDVHRS